MHLAAEPCFQSVYIYLGTKQRAGWHKICDPLFRLLMGLQGVHYLILLNFLISKGGLMTNINGLGIFFSFFLLEVTRVGGWTWEDWTVSMIRVIM